MKTSSWIKGNKSFGILLLRIFIGFRILYGVVDNMASWDQMMEFSFFLETAGFPLPTVNAVLSVYSQFLAAVLILLGYKFRFSSTLMVFNFLIALLFVHVPLRDTVEDMTPALSIFFICLTFVFTGAGKASLDNYFAKKSSDKNPIDDRLQGQSNIG